MAKVELSAEQQRIVDLMRQGWLLVYKRGLNGSQISLQSKSIVDRQVEKVFYSDFEYLQTKGVISVAYFAENDTVYKLS